MTVELALTLAIPLVWIALLVGEKAFGNARGFPDVRGWLWLGALAFIVSGVVSAAIPAAIAPLMAGLSVVDLSNWGLAAALPALLLTTFMTYWSHRAQHHFDLLWRFSHQLHHSAARVDVASSMMFHPMDLAIQATLTTLAAALLDLTADAAALAGFLGFFLAVFQHWNVRTPTWLGYVIQRPESHCLHHQRDVHSRNFGDLPLWDMLFGSFVNPRAVDVAVGFEPQAARRVFDMLIFRDVNQRLDAHPLGRVRD